MTGKNSPHSPDDPSDALAVVVALRFMVDKLERKAVKKPRSRVEHEPRSPKRGWNILIIPVGLTVARLACRWPMRYWRLNDHYGASSQGIDV